MCGRAGRTCKTGGLLAHWAGQGSKQQQQQRHQGLLVGAAQGSYYVRQGVQDYNETWGLLTDDWGAVRSPALVAELRQLQPRALGRGDLWPNAPASAGVSTK